MVNQQNILSPPGQKPPALVQEETSWSTCSQYQTSCYSVNLFILCFKINDDEQGVWTILMLPFTVLRFSPHAKPFSLAFLWPEFSAQTQHRKSSFCNLYLGRNVKMMSPWCLWCWYHSRCTDFGMHDSINALYFKAKKILKIRAVCYRCTYRIWNSKWKTHFILECNIK